MKLNFGSNNVRVDGYTNVDGLALENVDVVHDFTTYPYPFETDSIDDILMIEVLEHISFRQTHNVLSELRRILKPGGRLYIQVPDCGSMMEMYINGQIGEEIPHKVPKGMKNPELLELMKNTGKRVHPDRWLMAFCGAQKHKYDAHLNVFTKERLEEELLNAGFDKIDFGVDPLGWKLKVSVWK
jgi:predicted SAM-dependent methyltransferase